MAQHQTFTKLVRNDDDLVGMIAYTIYKKEKLNWIEQYKVKTNNEPDYATVQSQFNIDTDSDSKIQGYHRRAENTLNEFLNELVADEIEQYKSQIRDDAIIQTIKPRFWSDVWSNVVAGIIGALIVAVFNIGFWLYQIKDNPNLLNNIKSQAIEKVK